MSEAGGNFFGMFQRGPRRKSAEERRHERQYGYNPYGRPMRKGDGWHRKGWRGSFGEIAVMCKISPYVAGSHTLELREHETGDSIARSAINMQAEGYGAGPGGIVVFHRKRSIHGSMTAADYQIDSGDSLNLKTYDRFGNQVRWGSLEPLKAAGVDAYTFDDLCDAFAANPWSDDDPDAVRELKRSTRLTEAVIRDWFMWARATDDSGADFSQAGDRGLVAQAQRAAESANHRAHSAAAALAHQESRRLRVEGEVVRIASATTTTWYTMIPRFQDPMQNCAGPWVPGQPLLDTGNQARTMINAATAAAAGIVANPGLPPVQIRGVNGVDTYPCAYILVQIRGESCPVLAAIGGSQGLLVGEDVLGVLMQKGYSIGGF